MAQARAGGRVMATRIALTKPEIEALLAAAGNADPAMWEDYEEPEGTQMYDAFKRGMNKLRLMREATS